MRLTVAIVLFVLLCNHGQAQQTLTFDDKKFQFVLKVDTLESTGSERCYVSEIKVFRQKDKELLQIIEPPANDHRMGKIKDQIFIVEDMNFDGYNDFRLLEFLPAAPNIPYLYWFYDPKKAQFKYDTTLVGVTSPEFHHDEKIITSFWRDGCCQHGIDFYRYDKGVLILYERRVIGHDENDKEYTEVWKLKDGVLTKILQNN